MGAGDWIALAGLALGGLGGGLLGAIWGKMRSVTQMAEDWRGRPERKDPLTGVVIDPGRASLPGRIAALEAQIHPNHGTSLHDQVSWLAGEVSQLRTLFGEKIGASQ